MSQGFTVPGLRDNQVTNAKLRDSAALSVIGRSANSSGDPADIAASGTVGHLFQVLTGPTVGFGPATSGGVTGTDYHPDRAPSTGLATAYSDEFTGGAGLSWSNINSGPTTDTFANDVNTMTQTNEVRTIRGKTAGSGVISSDFTVYAKMNLIGIGNFNSAGIIFLDGGTWAAPTKMWFIYMVRDSANGFGAVICQSRTSFTGVSTTISGNVFANLAAYTSGGDFYLRMVYTASSKNLVYSFSSSGMPNAWFDFATTSTLTNHPDIGRFIDAQNGGNCKANFHWWRVFISGVNSATSDQYSGGVCGS